MRRVARGEAGDAFTVLYRRYGARLYRLGLRLLGDPGASEDMVQETFVRLWRSADRYDAHQGSVTTYLQTIARRVAIDMTRRASVRPHDRPADDPELMARVAAPDERFDRVVLALDVRDALQTLSERHRQVLELAYDADLSQREIAERVGIPVGTVKTRTHHALRALGEELRGRELHA